MSPVSVKADRAQVVIRAVNLEKRIGDKEVLRDISLELGPYSALAVLGPNGAGKTTLLRVLAGVWAPSRGQLWRFDQPVSTDGRTDPRVGYLGHQSFLYPSLTALENLTFYARLWGLNRPHERARDMLMRVGLTWSQSDPVRTFSRGMVQRAAIARALLPEPSLLLLDEPYTGLDLEAQVFLDRALMAFRQDGGSIVLITHNVAEALRISDAVTIMLGGKLVWWAPTPEWTVERLTVHYQQWLRGGRRHP